MKLKRNDLVSDFELIVKQEIKNHNDAVLAMNLVINKLNEKVLELSQSFEKKINKLDSKHLNLTHGFQDILNDFKQIREDFSKFMNDSYRNTDINLKEIQIIHQSFETVQRNQQKAQEEINLNDENLVIIFNEIAELNQKHELEMKRMTSGFSRDLKCLKEEILSMPSEALQMKTELMEELSMHKIDNEGLLKEIAVLKETTFINEKKIENLYTLIERLKITKDGLI